jgi:protease-4
MKSTRREKLDTFFYYVKNLFWVLLVLQFAPIVVSSIKDAISDTISPKTCIGLLKINGILADSGFYLKQIEKFSKDDKIKGLILSINSPGGLPGTSQAIYAELKKFKQNKPIVVVIENLCASGGYYVASPANKIICNPSSLIGSIGVLLQLPNVKELLDSWKIKFNYIQSGKYKTAGSPLKPVNTDEMEYFQKLSDNTYQQFIKDVALSRYLNEKDASKWADGKIFTGTQALELKLVDRFGNIQDGIDEIKKLAKIEGEIKLVHPKRQSNLSRLLGSGDDEDYGTESKYSEKMATFASEVYSKFREQQELNNSINIR